MQRILVYRYICSPRGKLEQAALPWGPNQSSICIRVTAVAVFFFCRQRPLGQSTDDLKDDCPARFRHFPILSTAPPPPAILSTCVRLLLHAFSNLCKLREKVVQDEKDRSAC